MPAKGEENLKSTMDTCSRVLAGLDKVTTEGVSVWKSELEQIAKTLQGLEGKFFFKTNPSIPSSNACRKDAVQLEELQQKGDWSTFAATLPRFRQNVETMVKKAEMPGTVLT
jgi:hypothetical protein